MSQYNKSFLFVIPALIWGSTWYAIKFQLGAVAPLVSVIYRFALAAIILVGFCLLTKRSLKFSRKVHLRVALQGLLLFGMNYWLIYHSEEYLSSGLVAVGFSTLIFFNIFFGGLFLGNRIGKKVIFSAVFGLTGTAIIFKEELLAFQAGSEGVKGLLFLISSVMIASMGNITSAKNSTMKIPVIQATALGMGYGSVLMCVPALALGKTFTIETSPEYLISLVYLSLPGSVIAFVAYLTLISQIGPEKAAYAIVVVPVVAVLISTFLEGFHFTPYTALGMVLLVLGNILALYRKC